MDRSPSDDAPGIPSSPVPDAVVVHTLDGRILFANAAFYEQQGLTVEEAAWLPPYGWSSLEPERREDVLERIRIHGSWTFDVVPPSGAPGVFRVESLLTETPEGPCVVSIRRDVTEQYHTAQALEFRSMLLDEVSDSVICHTLDGRIIYVNDAMCAERGFTREELLRMNVRDLSPKAAGSQFGKVIEILLRDGAATFESDAVTSDRRKLSVEIRARLVEHAGQRIVVSVIRDLSERKRTQAAVERMAFYDALTGLPNRRMLMNRLEIELAQDADGGQLIGIAFVDLDFLKEVNDNFGHAVGDRVLELAGIRLSSAVRRGDMVARLGGDEFIVMLTGLRDVQAVERVAGKLLDVFIEPFEVDGLIIPMTASIGVALNDEQGIDAARLISNADVAMYAAKARSRNAQATYSPHMRP